jgi:hypothetical protein
MRFALRRAAPSSFVEMALLASIVLIGGWIVWVVIGPIDLPWQSVDVSMRADATFTGYSVEVSGSTTLPDGSVIEYSYEANPSVVGTIETGTATVEDGSFAFEVTVGDAAPRNHQIEITFSCNDGAAQPELVRRVVGSHCEHLRGDQVYSDSGDPKYVDITVAFVTPALPSIQPVTPPDLPAASPGSNPAANGSGDTSCGLSPCDSPPVQHARGSTR